MPFFTKEKHSPACVCGDCRGVSFYPPANQLVGSIEVTDEETGGNSRGQATQNDSKPPRLVVVKR